MEQKSNKRFSLKGPDLYTLHRHSCLVKLIGDFLRRLPRLIAGRVLTFAKFTTRSSTKHHNLRYSTQHVSLDTKRPKRGPIQAGLPEVRTWIPRTYPEYTPNHPTIATTPKMELLSATSMPAAPSPRLSRHPLDRMVATRSS